MLVYLLSLNPRLVGQVFRHEEQVLAGHPDISLNPRLVGQVFRLEVNDSLYYVNNVLIPD